MYAPEESRAAWVVNVLDAFVCVPWSTQSISLDSLKKIVMTPS